MRHLARLACLAILVPVMLTACSSTSTNKPASAPAAGTTPAASASPSPSAPAVATGTQLAAALVTDMPAGFTENKSGTIDTGTSMQDETTGAMKSHAHCADLDGTAWIDVSGMAGVAFAQSDYLDKHNQEIAQEVDEFSSPAVAARTMTQLKSFIQGCSKFADASTKSITWHAAVSSAPTAGSGAFQAVLTSANVYGGVVDVAVQQGSNVVTTLYSSTKLATAKKSANLASRIVTNLGTN